MTDESKPILNTEKEEGIIIGEFWENTLGFCGCGNSFHLAFKMYQYLNNRYHAFDDQENKLSIIVQADEIGSEDFIGLLANVADKSNLTDHGGSIHGSWLSDLGEKWLFKLHKCYESSLKIKVSDYGR
jgi:hypothetical protein